MAATGTSIPDNKDSVTSPQHISALRKIMLLSEIVQARNARYETQLDAFLAQERKKKSNLSVKEVAGLTEGFSRQFYAPEYAALAEHTQIMKDLSALREKNKLHGLRGNKEKSTFRHYEFLSSMSPESYAASKLFDDATVESLKKEYPEVVKKLQEDIKAVRLSEFADLSPQKGTGPAVISLFNQRHPQLKNELTEMSRSKDNNLKQAGAAGLALVKWSSALMNPSGFLLSKAVGGILRTPTFQPMVKAAALSVRRVSEYTGITGALKKAMGKWSDVSVKRVAAGVAIGMSVGLVTLGLLQPEEAQQLYADISESIENFALNQEPVALANSDLSGSEMAPLDSAFTSIPDPVPPIDGSLAGLDPSVPPIDGSLAGLDPSVPPIDGSLAGLDPSVPQLGADGLSMNSASPLSSDELYSELMMDHPSGDLSPGTQATPGAVAPTIDGPASPSDVLSALNAPTELPSVADVKDVYGSADPSPESTGPSPSAADASTYKIKAGDTLSEIVEEQLKQSGRPYNYTMINEYVAEIAKANQIANPDVIFAGDSLKLPDIPKADVAVAPDVLQRGCDAITSVDPEKQTPRVMEALGELQKASYHTDPGFKGLQQAIECMPPVDIKPEPVAPNEPAYHPNRMMYV
jgi:hypothetical protein